MRLSIVSRARLHLGFIDFHGGLGRKFGGWGVKLATPYYHLSIGRGSDQTVTKNCIEPFQSKEKKFQTDALVRRMILAFDKYFSVTTAEDIVVHSEIPRHQGLGSGTQLALAAGHILARWHNLPQVNSRTIAQLFQRGKRSGVGIGVFDSGGVVVDGGVRDDKSPPPVIVRCAFPEDWQVVLVSDTVSSVGAHGQREKQAFAELPLFSAHCAGSLSRLLVMQLLPSLMEENFDAFVAAVTTFQNRIGDYFSPLQGGKFRSHGIAKLIDRLSKLGLNGYGQSSWGPTAFIFAKTKEQACRYVALVHEISKDLRAQAVCGYNIPSQVSVDT